MNRTLTYLIPAVVAQVEAASVAASFNVSLDGLDANGAAFPMQIVPVTASPLGGTFLNLVDAGSYTITYQAVDAAGNAVAPSVATPLVASPPLVSGVVATGLMQITIA
jgi:hypothetical protein